MSDLSSFITANLSLAISAHNSQPFTLKENTATEWTLTSEPARELPVADPHGKDHDLTAGAYIELIDILLKTHNRKIQNWTKRGKDIALFLSAEPSNDAKSQAVTKWDLAKKRFSFRGQTNEKKSLVQWPSTPYTKYITDEQVIDKTATIYDDVNYRFLVSPGYIEELYAWMRFRKSDPLYYKDGLNTEAMSLSAFEALGAAYIMHPHVFRFLGKIGMAKPLVLEKPKIKSASSLMIVYCPKGMSFIEQGRVFFNAWLEMTELGFWGCPMSLLSDAEHEKEELYKLFDLNTDQHQLINVLRACVLPKGYQRYHPARRDTTDVGGK